MEYDEAISHIGEIEFGSDIIAAIDARHEQELGSFTAATDSLNAEIASLKDDVKNLQVENYKLMTITHSGDSAQGDVSRETGDYKPLDYGKHFKKI